MVRSTHFKISFVYKSKLVKYSVDLMHIGYEREVHDFYRVEAKTGNRDLVKENGNWRVCGGAELPADVLEIVGAAIDQAVERDPSLKLPGVDQH